jgi:hypothetical protein
MKFFYLLAFQRMIDLEGTSGTEFVDKSVALKSNSAHVTET